MDKNLNENNSHSIGPCIVKNGILYDYFEQPIKDPTVLLDVGGNTVVLLKYGTKYMESDLFFKLGFDEIDKFKLISFNVSSDAKYTVDEICTFINWANNTIYVKDLAICISSEEQMHKKLSELMEIGF